MSEFHKDDSVEMESIVEHTYNGSAYKPGDRFSVAGDGGGWSAAMFADSLTAIGHAKRAEPKAKAKAKPKEDAAAAVEVKPDTKVAARSFDHIKPSVQTVKK